MPSTTDPSAAPVSEIFAPAAREIRPSVTEWTPAASVIEADWPAVILERQSRSEPGLPSVSDVTEVHPAPGDGAGAGAGAGGVGEGGAGGNGGSQGVGG